MNELIINFLCCIGSADFLSQLGLDLNNESRNDNGNQNNENNGNNDEDNDEEDNNFESDSESWTSVSTESDGSLLEEMDL